MDKPFSITGPTIVVGAAAVQIATGTGGGNSFRVRNTAATAQYFTTGQSNVASLTPAAGTPALNTIGMLANSVETFSNLLPWMIGNAGSAFEVTQGDGV